MKKKYRIMGAAIFLASSLFVSMVFAQTSILYPYYFPSQKTCSVFEACKYYCLSTEKVAADTDACIKFTSNMSTASPTSSPISTSIVPIETIPTVPANFAVAHRNGSEIVFSWMDRSSNEKYFKIMFQTSLIANKEVMTVFADTTTATYVAEPGYNYFRIRACNDFGCSVDSNVIGVEITSSTVTPSVLSTTMLSQPQIIIQSQTIEEAKLITQQAPQGYAAISGTLTDGNGAVVKTTGYVEVFNIDTRLGKAGGASFSDGKFMVLVPAGTYYVRAYLPPGSGYTVSQAQKVTVVTTATVQFVATANMSVVTGKVMDGTNVAASIVGRIVASNKDGTWQETAISQDGSYSMNLGAGTWLIGIELAGGSGYVVAGDRLFSVDVVPGGTSVERTFMVQRAATVVEGYVFDQNNTGVTDVYVAFGAAEFSPSLLSTSTSVKSLAIVRNVTTDARGYFSVTLPPGKYYVKTFIRVDRGYINAQERVVDVAGSRVGVNLTLQRPDVMINGFVYNNGSPVSNAFVWAWSKNGGYQEAVSNAQGAYSLHILGSTSWVVAAAAHVNGTEYRADEVAVDVALASAMHDVELRADRILPKAAILQTSAAALAVVTVASGGPTVVAPANAFSTSGSVEIAVVPDTRAPSQGQTKVVGTAYDFSASDGRGEKITKFVDEVVITIPYTDADIAALGVNEKSLVLSYWDEGVSAWKNVENSIVNTAANTVTASVDHFTRYAVLAPADVTPPEAPTVMVATALGSGNIKIRWTNPTKDFDHAKIYRSTLKGILGNIVVSEVAGAEYTDAEEILDGLIYYYTVRAVDPAGNESNNMTQASVVAIGNSPAASQNKTPLSSASVGKGIVGHLTKTLKKGSRGADVSLVQKLLVQENVYPEGKITGYFGNLTNTAVVRFQEKYTSEVLTPAGLTTGTGFVGAFTRAKMNALMK